MTSIRFREMKELSAIEILVISNKLKLCISRIKKEHDNYYTYASDVNKIITLLGGVLSTHQEIVLRETEELLKGASHGPLSSVQRDIIVNEVWNLLVQNTKYISNIGRLLSLVQEFLTSDSYPVEKEGHANLCGEVTLSEWKGCILGETIVPLEPKTDNITVTRVPAKKDIHVKSFYISSSDDKFDIDFAFSKVVCEESTYGDSSVYHNKCSSIVIERGNHFGYITTTCNTMAVNYYVENIYDFICMLKDLGFKEIGDLS